MSFECLVSEDFEAHHILMQCHLLIIKLRYFKCCGARVKEVHDPNESHVFMFMRFDGGWVIGMYANLRYGGASNALTIVELSNMITIRLQTSNK